MKSYNYSVLNKQHSKEALRRTAFDETLSGERSFLCLQALPEYPGHILTGEDVVAGGIDEGGIAVFLDVLLAKMNPRGILISEVS